MAIGVERYRIAHADVQGIGQRIDDNLNQHFCRVRSRAAVHIRHCQDGRNRAFFVESYQWVLLVGCGWTAEAKAPVPVNPNAVRHPVELYLCAVHTNNVVVRDDWRIQRHFLHLDG